MKKAIIFLFALLVLAAQAQAQRQPLAVLVVGVDSWMLGDVIAHIVGAELNRSKKYAVVTRDKLVQTKLKEFRRASEVKLCDVRAWAKANGLSAVCLVKGLPGGNGTFSLSNASQRYSAQLIDVADNSVSCSADFTFNHAGSPKEMTAVELNKVAWEVVGRLQSSSCKPPSSIRCFDYEPEMVFVKGGTFTMGCKSGRDTQSGASCSNNNSPTTTVTVSDFWIGKYEVTQKEYNDVVRTYYPFGIYPSFVNYGSGDRYPAYLLSYNWALEYITALNAFTGKNYRLPTEAEWEYAARGGNAPKNCPNGCAHSGSNTLWHVAWCEDNSGAKTHEVGTHKTQTPDGTPSPVDGGNELGIYDMNGNVMEFCSDSYRDALPSGNNPTYDNGESSPRVLRGGGFSTTPTGGNNASRHYAYPRDDNQFYGIRVVVSAAP